MNRPGTPGREGVGPPRGTPTAADSLATRCLAAVWVSVGTDTDGSDVLYAAHACVLDEYHAPPAHQCACGAQWREH